MKGKAFVALVCLAVVLGTAAFVTRALDEHAPNSNESSADRTSKGSISPTDREPFMAQTEETVFPAEISETETAEVSESTELQEEASGEDEVSLEAPSSPVVEKNEPLSVSSTDVSSSSLVGGSYAAIRDALTVDGVLGATNAERYKEGLLFLASNARLNAAARIKLTDIFEKQYFAHESPTGETIGDLAKKVDYVFIRLGENLAMGNFKSDRALVEAWMNSPGHRANILKEGYSEIGIAVGRGTMNGRELWVAVQEFGLPRSVCPEIPAGLKSSALSYKDQLLLLMRVVDVRREALEKYEKGSQEFANAADLYNIAARAYNERLAVARSEFDSYNGYVQKFNACVEEKSGS